VTRGETGTDGAAGESREVAFVPTFGDKFFHGAREPWGAVTNVESLPIKLIIINVANDLYARLDKCRVGDQAIIFGKSFSDRLPIIADFKIQS
jgi:hypothetical protein